jgi:branched-chain amino acid transport system substrate-binding protein
MCSGGAVAAIPTYRDAGMVAISGSTTGVAVTQQDSDIFFRTAWNDATQGAEMAEYAYNELGHRSAFLVNDQSVYGAGLMEVFKATWEDLGGEVAGEQAVTVGEKDFSPVVTQIQSATPDIVVFGGFIAEGAVLVSQIDDAQIETDFMGADGIADQDFIDQSQGAAEGAYVSRGPTPTDNAAYDAFAAAHQTEYNAPPGQFGEHYYDAANILMDAIEGASEVDGDGNLVIDVDAMLEAIRTVSYDGASGQIEFDEVGDRVVTEGVVNRIDQVTNNALERIQ